jgi:hypothetical protein
MFNLIVVSWTCFERPSVHSQEDLYLQFYGITFTHPYKRSGRWQDVLDTKHILLSRLTTYAEEVIGDHQCGF